MAPRMFGVGEDGSEIIGSAQGVSCPGVREQLVLSLDDLAAISDLLGSLVRSIEQSERELALCSRQFASPQWIDNVARVHARSHVAIAAGSSNVEQSHAFHKERTLFRIEDRESLIDLNLKCVTFDLAEIGIDRGVQSHIGCDSVFSAQSRGGFIHDMVPCIRRGPRLIEAISHTGKQLEQSRLPE